MDSAPQETEASGQTAPNVLPADAAIHAGFWWRCAAMTGDALFLLLFVLTLPGIIVLVPLSMHSESMHLGLAVAISWLYFPLMESSPWQATVGKRVMSIKVVDLRGRCIGFWRAAARFVVPCGALFVTVFFARAGSATLEANAIWIGASIFLFINGTMPGWTARKQSLMDKLTGTCVVFEAAQSKPSAPWRGWTLNPILLFSLLGFLAALISVAMMKADPPRKTAIAKLELSELDKSLQLFRLDTGRYPTTAEGLQALIVKPPGMNDRNGPDGWNGPYLRDVPDDPWGNPYRYRNPGPGGDIEILTLGADNAPGGTGANADVRSPP